MTYPVPLLLFRLGDYLNYHQQMLLTLLILGVACAILGCFLVLRRLSMVTDALSHTILLGIILAYFVTKDLDSPLLFVGAGLFGVFTVYCIELLSSTGLVKNDDSVGITFPLFFSLAVILISTFARNVHIDTDVVLMGQVIMIPLNNLEIFGIVLPKAMVYMTFMLLINLLFVTFFYKELKISTFDPEFSTIIGFSSGGLFYCLMTLTSFTAVSAFDAVGTMMAIALFVGPAASAYLITKDLKKMILVAILYASVNTLIGFYLAIHINVSISGMIATITGLSLILTTLFNRDGVITAIYLRDKSKRDFQLDLMIIHMGNHENTPLAGEELGITSMRYHLNWDQKTLGKKLKRLMNKGYVESDREKKIYRLTPKGKLRYDMIKLEYYM